MSFDYINFMSERLKNDYAYSQYDIEYPAYVMEHIMLEMRDGIKLKTSLYKPVLEGRIPETKPLPVILERSCYPQNEVFTKIHGENLARRGYILVSQYCRGTGGSEGDWVPNIHEREDGLDTIMWLNDQKWVEKIGYWGNSYLALTGWAIADQVPEKVKGMLLTHYGTDRYTSAYEKGMFRQDVLTSWAMDNAGHPVEADYIESCKYMPHIEVDEKLWGGRLLWYRDWISNSHQSDAYWQQGWWKQLSDIPSKVKVPLYIRSGWYDHHHGSSMKTWDNLSEETKQKSWLDIGGWNHFFLPCMEDCEIENLNNSEVLAALEWFELTLKRKITPKQRIRTYVVGRDKWMDQSTWPNQVGKKLEFYFDRKAQEDNFGFLGTQAKEGKEEFSYLYDPSHPISSHGAESLLKNVMKNGSLTQPEIEEQSGVLSFVSDPLPKKLCINGKIKIRLFVSSDCPDTAFIGKVMEIRENGKSYSVRSSITSICHEIGRAYDSGTVVEVSIDMWDIVYEMKMGSRLRIDISPSDFPQYHIHSNYDGDWSLQHKSQKAHQTIYCGVDHPSRVEIPYNI